MHHGLVTLGLTAACIGCGFAGFARANVMLDETSIVAAPGAAQASEFSFTASTA
jgi:hypothetical protein